MEANVRPQADERSHGAICVMSSCMGTIMKTPRQDRIALLGHLNKMAHSGHRPQSKPRRAASATAAVREPRPSLWRMLATWRCTVW